MHPEDKISSFLVPFPPFFKGGFHQTKALAGSSVHHYASVNIQNLPGNVPSGVGD